MQQFLHVNGKGVVGHVSQLKNCGMQLSVYINETDMHGNVISNTKTVVRLFKAAERYAIARKVQPGDHIYLMNAKFNVFEAPDGRTHVSLVCNYANQLDIVSNQNHVLLDNRAIGESA